MAWKQPLEIIYLLKTRRTSNLYSSQASLDLVKSKVSRMKISRPLWLLIQEMDRLLHQDIHSLLKFPDLLKFPFLCIAAIDSFRGASGSITSITPCLKLVKCSNYVLPQHALPQVANPVLCAPSGAWAPTHLQNPGLDSPFVPHTVQVCVWSEQLCRGASQMGTAPSRHLLARPFQTQPSR